MDKRILKTKKCLKDTLIQILTKKPFEKISVTEICNASNTGRVTFYNYYEDKYDLLLDCLKDIKQDVEQQFNELQCHNNPTNDLSIGFQNLVNTLIDTKNSYKVAALPNNYDLMMMYYEFIMDIFQDFESTYGGTVKLKYNQKQLNSFLALGFYGFLHSNNDIDKHEMSEKFHLLIKDLTDSNLFK